MLLLCATGLAATPHVGAAFGLAISSGYDRQYAYTSYAPYGMVNATWFLGPIEGWLGLSASGLVASQRSEVIPAAPLQGEFGLGVGNLYTSVGFFGGIGLVGTEFGGYGRVLFPDGRYRAWGLEARLFTMDGVEDVGGVLMGRLDFGRFKEEKPKKKAPSPQKTPPPVYHEDPYGN